MAELSENLIMSDEDLLDFVRSMSGDSVETAQYTSALISRYIQVIIIKANKLKSLYRGERTGSVDCEDLISEGFMGLLSAIRSYSAAKGTFSVFANTCIANKMKSYILKTKRTPPLANDFDLNMVEDLSPNADELLIKRESDDEFFALIKTILSEFEYNVLKHYMNGYTYRQIAEKYGVNHKSIDNALSRARGKLKKLKK